MDNYMEQASQSACPTTTSKEAFIWYCDEHDVHGNADHLMEAHYVATAHAEWTLFYTDQEEKCEYVIVQGGVKK